VPTSRSNAGQIGSGQRRAQWGNRIDFCASSHYPVSMIPPGALPSLFVLLAGVTLSALVQARTADTGVVLATAFDDNITVYRDIPYDHVAGVDPKLLSLDIYTSKRGAAASRDPEPVVVYIHGGGWKIGDKANPDSGPHKAVTFVSSGFVYVAINYRLSPTVHHPTHARDVAKALAWVADNIGRYSGDPERIYAMGHSAGAHLAALVATDESYLKREGHSLKTIKGDILLDVGAYDIPWVMDHLTEERGRELLLSAFGNDPKVWADASPIYHVAAGKDIPPMLVFYTDRPRTSEVSRRFVQALKKAGVPAAAIEARGKNHGSILRDIGEPGDAETQIILEFLRGKSLSEMPGSI